jgi:hypothetical protein
MLQQTQASRRPLHLLHNPWLMSQTSGLMPAEQASES